MDDDQEKSKKEKAKDLTKIMPKEFVVLINKKTILSKVFVNSNKVLLNTFSSKQLELQSQLLSLIQLSSLLPLVIWAKHLFWVKAVSSSMGVI